MSQDLLFSALQPSSTDLVFGEAPTGGNVTERHVTLNGTLPALTVSAQVLKVDVASLAGALPSLAMTGTATYDNATTRYMHLKTAGSFSTAVEDRPTLSVDYQTAARTEKPLSARHQTATHTGHDTAIHSQGAVGTQRTAAASHQTAVPVHSTQAPRFQSAIEIESRKVSRWQVGAGIGGAKVSRFQRAKEIKYTLAGAMQEGVRREAMRESRMGYSEFRIGPNAFVSIYQTAKHPDQGRSVRSPTTPTQTYYTPSTDLLFSDLASTTTLDLLFRRDDDTSGGTTTPSTVIVPVKKVYMVTNILSLKRQSDNAVILAKNLSLSVDKDSWAWTFSASIDPVSEALVTLPNDTSDPVKLVASVNGTDFVLMVENMSRDRSFGKSTLNISGHTQHILLDAPYAAEQNFANSSARTAQQLLNDALTINNVPMGWTIDFELDDWSVPAGAFNVQGTYIKVLSSIVQSAGGYLLPHPSQQRFTVKPSYPAAPWDWASLAIDYVLPSDVTSKEAINWVKKPNYNRVYVSGESVGVVGAVTRTGTAGDVLAPMVTDRLITHEIAARQRGKTILSNTGRQQRINLRLPVLDTTGILRPGHFIKYSDNGTDRLGLVRGVSVETNFATVWQTLDVESHL